MQHRNNKVRVHLAGGVGNIVDDTGDVDGAAGGDIHVRGALDESLWLQDRQPYVMRDDGSGGHLTLILACVTTLH